MSFEVCDSWLRFLHRHKRPLAFDEWLWVALAQAQHFLSRQRRFAVRNSRNRGMRDDKGLMRALGSQWSGSKGPRSWGASGSTKTHQETVLWHILVSQECRLQMLSLVV